MKLEPGTTLHGFTVRSAEELPEIDGQAFVCKHDASGARLLYLANDDSNKSFAIGFRTPPKDDTGTFHILEHSVLCGSDRFPVKEPFVNLLKSSMQTYLNALTFPDKTMYPVASTNEKDLFNLMDVYLDAVFHPMIYRKRAIFEQEGWHLEPTEDGLVYNGVVYNEMKGVLSDANSVLLDDLQAALYPDTCYAFESGGTPAAIPTLSYEEWLDEHRRHYRTDNSYIVLYGDLDFDRALAFLDERYLTPVAAEQAALDAERQAAGLEPLEPRTIELQPPVKAPYSARLMDTPPENACAIAGYIVGTAADRMRVEATDVLLDALFGSNEAPLKRAFLDEGIAAEVNAYVESSLLQPFCAIQLNMPGEGAGAALAESIETHMRKLLEDGLDHDLIEAALSHAEFQLRERDMSTADGVVFSIMSLTSWLHDDDAPLDYIRFEDLFADLRAALDGDYFEKLCESVFLDNDHMAVVEIVPAPGTGEGTGAEATAAALAELASQMGEDERRAVADEVEALRALQEAPDTPEALATLPRLTIDDIGDAPERPAFHLTDDAPIACLIHEVPTHGIAYAYRYFDLDCVAFYEMPYVAVLLDVLGKLDTTQHTAAEIDTLTQSKLGNLTFYFEVFKDGSDPSVVVPKLVVGSSALSANAEWLAHLPREIMLQTDFTDTGKILDRLQQHKIALEQLFINAGHNCAFVRMQSYCTKSGMLREQLANVELYRFLCDLIEHFDERANSLPTILEELAERIFRDGGCTVSFAGSQDDYRRFWEADPGTGRADRAPAVLEVPEPVRRNEGFIVPSDVCYAALGWDRRQLGAPYTGAWSTAARMLSYDYLWNEVRVKGGAYGTGFQSIRTGAMRFYSYRDPHLDETLERFAQASAWLSEFEPTPEDMEGFVVATVASIDAPIKPRTLIRRQATEYFNGLTEEERLRIRHEAATATLDDVHALAPLIARAVDEQALCVFGGREILENAKTPLELINLIA